jgi:DNA modification methylase
LRPLSNAVNRQPTAHALSRIIRRPRIDAAAALLYSPRMAKKIYLRPRCVQLARILKKIGSFYYHCDWHASHYVKIMLDQIFGRNNFTN